MGFVPIAHSTWPYPSRELCCSSCSASPVNQLLASNLLFRWTLSTQVSRYYGLLRHQKKVKGKTLHLTTVLICSLVYLDSMRTLRCGENYRQMHHCQYFYTCSYLLGFEKLICTQHDKVVTKCAKA